MIELYLISWVIFSIEWLWSEQHKSNISFHLKTYIDFVLITLLLPLTALVIMLITIDEKFKRR